MCGHERTGTFLHPGSDHLWSVPGFRSDPEEWEYSLPKDQIDAALIHAHYFSRKDIDACLAFDISAFDDHVDATQIRELFIAFQETYRAEVEN
jgi:hypothetical protein